MKWFLLAWVVFALSLPLGLGLRRMRQEFRQEIGDALDRIARLERVIQVKRKSNVTRNQCSKRG